MAMTAMNMVSAGGFSGGKLSFKNMYAGGCLCTLQENPHFGSRRSKLDHLTVHISPKEATEVIKKKSKVSTRSKDRDFHGTSRFHDSPRRVHTRWLRPSGRTGISVFEVDDEG
jgi:hypothetical protein